MRRYNRNRARKLLSDRPPYRAGKRFYGTGNHGWEGLDDYDEILALAEKIQSRRKRRGIPNKVNFPGEEYRPSEPKRGGCTFCWPEAGSIHYKGGRVDRRRLNNPKYFSRMFLDAA